MDLRNWEMFVGTGQPVVGANVYAYEASLAHPNTGAVIATTTTNSSGMWQFTGLTDTPKDVKVEYAGKTKWYKGLTLHNVYTVFEDAEDTTVEQNLIKNGGFEINTGAPSFSPGTSYGLIVDDWLAKRGTGDVLTITRVTSPKAVNSQFALQAVYTKSAGDGWIIPGIPAILIYALRGKTISFSAQVQQTVANGISAFINDGVNPISTTSSPTTGSMVTLSVTGYTVSPSANDLQVGFRLNASGTFQMDNAMLNFGTTALPFVPRLADTDASYTINEVAPTADTAPLATILNNLADRVRGIIGAAGNDWKDAIPASLTSLFANKANLSGAAFTGAISVSGNTVWHAGNDGAGSGLDADMVDGQHASAIIAAAFPSGLGGWVRKASEIPSGFARETALDGRVPIGAGTTAGVTFVEETNYGSSWGHQHQNGWHLHYAAELGIAGQTSTPTENEAAGVSGGLVAADGHKHNAGSLDVTGTTGYSGGEDTTSTTWIFPSRAVVWVRKS